MILIKIQKKISVLRELVEAKLLLGSKKMKPTVLIKLNYTKYYTKYKILYTKYTFFLIYNLPSINLPCVALSSSYSPNHVLSVSTKYL